MICHFGQGKELHCPSIYKPWWSILKGALFSMFLDEVYWYMSTIKPVSSYMGMVNNH